MLILLFFLFTYCCWCRQLSVAPEHYEANVSALGLAAYKIKDLTGPGHTTKFGVGGTDLGICYEIPNHSGMCLFGDSFDNAQAGGPGWRSPIGIRSQTGFTKGHNLSSGIIWDNCAGGARCKELTINYHQREIAKGPGGEYRFSEFTVIPSDAITVQGKVYMFATSVHDWGSKWWMSNFNFISVADRDPFAENFRRTDTFWANNGKGDLRQQITCDKGGDGFVYCVGSNFNRDIHGMLLMRVPEGQILNKNAWQEWGFHGSWAWRGPYQGTPFLPDSCGETSLRKIEGVWVLAYFDVAHYSIVTRYAQRIDGAWSIPKPQVIGGSWSPGLDGGMGFPPGTVAQLYGGYIHPKSTLKELTLIVSQWKNPGGWPYRSMQFMGSVYYL